MRSFEGKLRLQIRKAEDERESGQRQNNPDAGKMGAAFVHSTQGLQISDYNP
jgi:hypothetical protein